MPKYLVTVCRDRPECSDIEIEADNPNQACDRALLAAKHNGGLLSWTPDASSIIGEPYLGSPATEVEGAE